MQSIFCGIGNFFLGFALLRLEIPLGIISKIASGLKIASGVLFILVFMAWLEYLLLIPAVFLQIILLYKIEEFIKRESVDELA